MSRLIKFVSWRDWGLIRYNPAVEGAALLFYIALARRWFALDFVRDVGLFLLLSLAGTAYGYLVNDLGDLELDRLAGKPNVFHDVRPVHAALVVLLVLVLVVACGLAFAGRPAFVPLWVAWVLAATAYSLPPVRLKERGALGLVVTIAAQRSLPAAMAFAALGCLRPFGAPVFVVYITLRGICSDVGHQMRDRERDVAAGASTFAVRRGHRHVARLYGISLELEALALGAVLLVLLLDVPPLSLGRWRFLPGWPPLVAYLLLLPLTLGRAYVRLNRGERVDPYDASQAGPARDLIHLIHHPFPSVLLPLYLAVLLTVHYWPNVVFVVGLVLVHRLHRPSRWLGSWPIRTLMAWLRPKA